MASSRPRSQRYQGSRQSLDRRVDKWIETGRQVVDGVAGNRPGMRRLNPSRLSGSSLEKVGRWVGDKLDWFLEEDDAWIEPWQAKTQSPMSSSSNKRPLDAISLRARQSQPLADQENAKNFANNEWPDEASFRVDRWKRPSFNEKIDSGKATRKRPEAIRSERRNLPRSSRKRN